MKNAKLSPRDQARVDTFLTLFSKERTDIRAELASILPAYNELLEMHALSFEEFALQIEAEKQGLDYTDPLFSYASVRPTCPTCRTHETTKRVGPNMFVCNRCKTKFAANHNSISAGSKLPSIVWLKILRSILDLSSIQDTCRTCGITPTTYYNIRNRIFYAMQLMMEPIKLYGVVSCDITFSRVSFKGLDLSDPDYPEDSVFFRKDYKPRAGRKRGQHNPMSERGPNSVSIFTAIDDRGHVFARYVGLGQASSKRLFDCIGHDKILLTTPEKDPSPFHQGREGTDVSNPGSRSLLVSDKESAIIKYAAQYGLPHEYHVFRKNGVQFRLPDTAHNIQNVNQLHSKLKAFLRSANYVSTKYLPGFLVLFEFLQNTKASPEAIAALFKTLAQPGLGKSRTFYEEQYVIPNYLQQWLSDGNPLKHLKQNQIHSYYLYKTRLEAISANSDNIQSVAEIAALCGISPSSVRRNYKNLEAAGYGPVIMEMYRTGEPQRKRSVRKAFSPDILALYDAFYSKSCSSQRSLAQFLRDYNASNGTNLKYRNVAYYFKEIEGNGIRGGQKGV